MDIETTFGYNQFVLLEKNNSMENAFWNKQKASYVPEHLTATSSSYSSSSRYTTQNGRFDHTANSQYLSLPVAQTQTNNTRYTTFSAPLSGSRQTGVFVPLKHIRRAVDDINTLAVQPTEDPQNQSREQLVANGRSASTNTQRQTQNPSSTATAIAAVKSTPSSSTNATVNRTKGPKYPKYTSTVTRLDSFNDCQRVSVSTRLLSEAGFFYAGSEDCTRCFACGIGLRNWSKNDDPWTEHARASLNCDHVVSMKGREFVNLVKLALELTDEKTGTAKTADVSEPSSPNVRQGSSDDINKLMKTKAAQSVLENDYSEDLVKQAIVRVMRSKGANTITEDVPTAKRPNMAAVLSCENQNLRNNTVCSYCKRLEVSLVFLPCGHLVSCSTCGNKQKSCVTCGQNVKGTVRTYKA
ncbi:BIR7A-like protein [Mya arenaria]|uniref:BIR7A-like protein n=1 Tax=Mya arenaria TaxID=6604 RepID=A0ABY7F5E9_MYAAR|nr:BIR7A-like protein [Mya arenaria]